MIDYSLLYHIVVRHYKKAAVRVRAHYSAIDFQFWHLGTTAYTSDFVYWIEKGCDINVIKLAVSGIVLVSISNHLSSQIEKEKADERT